MPEAASTTPHELAVLFEESNPRLGIDISTCRRLLKTSGTTAQPAGRTARPHSLVDEIKEIAGSFDLRVKESVDANGGAAVRRMLDGRFEAAGGWAKKTAGDIDWVKCKVVNGTQVCIGVEVQVSARSDLLVVDRIHLAAAFRDGRLDAGVIIVPDRGPCLSDAKRHARVARLEDSPLILLAIKHDGPGPALPKQKKS